MLSAKLYRSAKPDPSDECRRSPLKPAEPAAPRPDAMRREACKRERGSKAPMWRENQKKPERPLMQPPKFATMTPVLWPPPNHIDSLREGTAHIVAFVACVYHTHTCRSNTIASLGSA